MYICALCACWFQGCQKTILRPLKLVLQMVMNHHVVAAN